MRFIRSLAVVAAVSPVAAFAALPEAVTTSITAAQTDGIAAVGLLASMGAAVFLIRKVLSKLGIM